MFSQAGGNTPEHEMFSRLLFCRAAAIWLPEGLPAWRGWLTSQTAAAFATWRAAPSAIAAKRSFVLPMVWKF
jgi:hypothetical protein